MTDIAIFLGAIVLDIISLFIAVYFVVTLSDLECDYINARACCDKLNKVISELEIVIYNFLNIYLFFKFVIPEIVIKVIPTVLFLLTGHWILLILNLPFDAWYIYKFVKKPASHTGYFDPAEIHNRGELKSHMQNSLVRLGEHLVFFFIYLYWYVLDL